MKNITDDKRIFIDILKAGLWEKEIDFIIPKEIAFTDVLRIAEEQSVVGLIASGLEHVTNIKVPKDDVFLFVGQALQIEQRNLAMNVFLSSLIDRMREADIYTILVKGQGVAQCYERPLWRACGDIDLFLSNDNYLKAKKLLLPLASRVDEEDEKRQHISMTIDSWEVELHGTLDIGLIKSVDRGIDDVKKDIFEGGNIRSWMDGNTIVFLPSPDNDVIIIFTHILQHLFKGGIGLRQICDLCRLIWVYRDKINKSQLEKRLRKMGVMSEWRTMAALAVDILGLPVKAMPLYSSSRCWKRKADNVLSFIFETGNFGQNRDTDFYDRYPYVIAKLISLWWHTKDAARFFFIFPLDSLKIWGKLFGDGLIRISKGK